MSHKTRYEANVTLLFCFFVCSCKHFVRFLILSDSIIFRRAISIPSETNITMLVICMTKLTSNWQEFDKCCTKRAMKPTCLVCHILYLILEMKYIVTSIFILHVTTVDNFSKTQIVPAFFSVICYQKLHDTLCGKQNSQKFPWKHCQGIIRRDASPQQPRNIKKLSDYEECQDMQIAVFLNRTFWWANMWNIDAIPLIYILLIYYILYISERKFRILEIVLDLLVVYGSSVTSSYLS